MTVLERTQLLSKYIRGGLKTRPSNIGIQPSQKSREFDILPQEVTPFYKHPAKALVDYINMMTDTIETTIVYGEYKQTPDGQQVIGGKFYKTLLDLYETGQISEYDLFKRVPNLVKAKLATRKPGEAKDFKLNDFLRNSTYLSTIVDFDRDWETFE